MTNYFPPFSRNLLTLRQNSRQAQLIQGMSHARNVIDREVAFTTTDVKVLAVIKYFYNSVVLRMGLQPYWFKII